MALNLKFWQSEFFKNVSYQMIGTAVAQVLPFAATPVLTRLYSEENFALYTSFFAVSSILVVVAGGRYQLAIILPRKNVDAIRLFAISTYLTSAYAALLLALSFIFITHRHNTLEQGLYFIPLYVFFFGMWNSFSYLSIRNKTFFQNALSKVWQSAFYIVGAVILGLLNFHLFGLIIGKIVGVIASAIYLFKKSFLKIRFSRISKLKEVALNYSDYPKYGIFPALLDVMSVQGLVLILTLYYPVKELGYYGLTALVLSAPLGLIGTSFRDVFYQRIATLISNRDIKGSVRFFKYSALGLLLTGLPVCAALYFFGPVIFEIVFGEKWIRSGEFASILWASFLIHLVVSPLSSVFNAAHKIKIASLWQTLYFLSTFITLGTSALIFELNVDSLLFVYVMHELVLYTIYLALQYTTLKKLS